MVNRNLNDNHKHFRLRVVLVWSSKIERLQSIERRPCSFGSILGLVFWLVFSDDCELDVVIENIYIFHGHVLR